MDDHHVLIVGLPRSGSTLVCELLNRLPQTVALDEPMDRLAFAQGTTPRRRRSWPSLAPRRPPAGPDTDLVCDNIGRFLAVQRASLLDRGCAVSKHVGGRVTGAKVADERDASGARRKLATRGEISVDKGLRSDFLLAMKHNSAFAALHPELDRRFRVRAVVRNPLAILASWQEVPFAVARGRAALAELLDPRLEPSLDAIDDQLDRQIHLLDWFFRRFAALPEGHVVRYEEIVATGGAALAAVDPSAELLSEPLTSRDQTLSSRSSRLDVLAHRLLDESDATWWNFYSRRSVLGLLEAPA